MANLSDLVDAGESFIPVIQDIFTIWTKGGDTGTISTAPLDNLSQLVSQANVPTDDAKGLVRAQAITALSDALTEIISQAAQSTGVSLPSETVTEINNECDALQTAFGLLAERQVFNQIVQLLPAAQVNHIKQEIADAKSAIQSRQKAAVVLSTSVDVLILAAEVAIKVAAM